MKKNLIEKINNKTAVICIFGLGYVGLPLLIRFSEIDYKVVGVDVDQQKVDMLNGGISYIEHISNRKIRLAIVGCGRISKNHFGSIEQHQDNVELIAISNTNSEVLNRHEKRYQVKGYIKMEDMLQNKKIDLVSICRTSRIHSMQTIMAAENGVHVMTEKPMATRWSDGLRMVKVCDDAMIRLFVVKQNRYNTTLQHLKRAINEKRFGKIHMVNLNVFWTRTLEYYDQAHWRGTWKYDVGAFMNLASHYVDLLGWLTRRRCFLRSPHGFH